MFSIHYQAKRGVKLRVLITGGAGFLGSHLCDRFLKEGYEVVALDNFITGSIDNIAHLAGNPKFKFIRHDVSNYIFVDGPIDAVLHFASPASPPGYLKYPIQTLKVGALGTHNALGVAKAKGARFLLASTSEIYGDPLVHPQTEDYNGNVDPIGPRGVYDEAKRFAEALTMAYHNEHGVKTRIVRIFNTYGPRMSLDDGRVVPNFIAQALHGEPLTVYGEGTQTRSFCFYSDLIEGLYRLLNSDYHMPVNIGNPYTEMTMLELAELVNRIGGSKGGIVIKKEMRIAGDPQVRQPDITRAREVLDWEPKVKFEEGLQETFAFFQKKVHANS